MAQEQILQVREPPLSPRTMAQMQAYYAPSIFGDERDSVLTKFFQLEAAWGTGKAFFGSGGQQTVEFHPENRFNIMKACCYKYVEGLDINETLKSLKSGKKDLKNQNSDPEGLVCMVISKPASEVASATFKTQLCDGLKQLLSSSVPNANITSVKVHSFVSNNEKSTTLILYVCRRESPTSPEIRVFSTDLTRILCQQNIASQLQTHLGVTAVYPQVSEYNAESLLHYLSTPPSGIHPTLWQQAINNNPHRKNFLPIVSIGFSSLLERAEAQQHTNKLLELKAKTVKKEVKELEANDATLRARAKKLKSSLNSLSHRLLNVISKLETRRYLPGTALTMEEKEIQNRIANIQFILSKPSEFGGKINELKVFLNANVERAMPSSSMFADKKFYQSVKTHLMEQQRGIAQLMEIVRQDTKDLDIMSQDIENLTNDNGQFAAQSFSPSRVTNVTIRG